MARLWCIAWGDVAGVGRDHPDCPVILYERSESAEVLSPDIELPAACPCECRTCKRAWFADGRPRVVFGKVYRENDPRPKGNA